MFCTWSRDTVSLLQSSIYVLLVFVEFVHHMLKYIVYSNKKIIIIKSYRCRNDEHRPGLDPGQDEIQVPQHHFV
jgi:hypothetical protein